MKVYSIENLYRFGMKVEGEYALYVQDENDTDPQMTTIRSHNEIELRELVNLLNLCPQILIERAKRMTNEQVFGKSVA